MADTDISHCLVSILYYHTYSLYLQNLIVSHDNIKQNNTFQFYIKVSRKVLPEMGPCLQIIDK